MRFDFFYCLRTLDAKHHFMKIIMLFDAFQEGIQDLIFLHVDQQRSHAAFHIVFKKMRRVGSGVLMSQGRKFVAAHLADVFVDAENARCVFIVRDR